MNSEASILKQCMTFFIDKLWLVLLLTPLFVIAIIGVQQLLPSEHSRHINSKVAVSVGSVEISAVELAAIVAKPIGELLAMEVYSVGSSLLSTAPAPSSALKRTAALYEIRPAGERLARRATYQLVNTNKIRKRKDTS